MTVDRKDFLSFLIKPSGEVVPAMPHEEEFSAQQIWDQVAGYPELICETCDGFLLFRDRRKRQRTSFQSPRYFRLYRVCPAAFPRERARFHGPS